ncbi:MAG: hypothetical protein ACRD39_04200, partial [Nitrososphaeraceae archaeon]
MAINLTVQGLLASRVTGEFDVAEWISDHALSVSDGNLIMTLPPGGGDARFVPNPPITDTDTCMVIASLSLVTTGGVAGPSAQIVDFSNKIITLAAAGFAGVYELTEVVAGVSTQLDTEPCNLNRVHNV